MESCANGCSEWWYYYGLTGSQMVSQALQNGGRMVNLSSYPGCGGSCFTGAMINNSNAITTRVGNLIRNGGIAGTEGLYLKQVNGPVLANLEDSAVFEPASSIKVVANLYAMTQVEKGNIKLTAPITHYTNAAESCPNPPVVSGTESLGTAIREMMWHSDNARTLRLPIISPTHPSTLMRNPLAWRTPPSIITSAAAVPSRTPSPWTTPACFTRASPTRLAQCPQSRHLL